MMDGEAIRQSLDPGLVDRFALEVERLWPAEDREREGADEPDMLGLAISGGPDSLAMLLLADAAMPGEIAVASVDHGLRPEAAAEVAMVEDVCRALDIPFTALRLTVGRGNLQARARERRYAALLDWVNDARPGMSAERRIGALATAHHADDQAETLLMRLLRGSGLSGLAGVREAAIFDPDDYGASSGDAVPVIRPLLGWRKTELSAIVSMAALEAADDPTNYAAQFDRVRMREHLARNDWLDPAAIAISAQHLADGWRAIEWYAQIDWEEMVHRDADGRTLRYNANVPRIVQIETVRRIVAELGGKVTRAEAARAADRLWRGENASLGGVFGVPGIEHVEKVGVKMRVWRFRVEPARRVH